MSVFSSAGFFSSMFPSGSPLTNRTMSGLRRVWVSWALNWLTASQSFSRGLSKSRILAGTPLMVPSGKRLSTVTPLIRFKWNDRFLASRVGPSGLVMRSSAVSSASSLRSGLSLSKASLRRCISTICLKSSRSCPGVPGAMSGPYAVSQPRSDSHSMAACSTVASDRAFMQILPDLV